MSEDTMQRVEDIFVERVNGFGVSEATVQRQGQTAFLIQLPGVDNAQEALKLLGEPGKLEFIEFGEHYRYRHGRSDREADRGRGRRPSRLPRFPTLDEPMRARTSRS